MLKIIAWNIARCPDAWRRLIKSDADVALLQEASEPPADIAAEFKVDGAPWRTGVNQRWRTAVVKLSDRVELNWLSLTPLGEAIPGALAVSRPGPLAAAVVSSPVIEPFIAVSACWQWETPHALGGSEKYADASVHRLISDLSALVTVGKGPAILVAGDLNILKGYGENGRQYWGARYATVFDRMGAVGLPFVGPQAPEGRQADPWPKELPPDSKNVPTHYRKSQTLATATRQLDFVFASETLAKRLRVRALNEPEIWGPSDHCQIEIQISSES
jgi:Endonuclease/Exonuclease/phosphatase family